MLRVAVMLDGLLYRVKDGGLRLQAVVNNAGISAFGWAEGLPLSRYKANMEVQ